MNKSINFFFESAGIDAKSDKILSIEEMSKTLTFALREYKKESLSLDDVSTVANFLIDRGKAFKLLSGSSFLSFLDRLSDLSYDLRHIHDFSVIGETLVEIDEWIEIHK